VPALADPQSARKVSRCRDDGKDECAGGLSSERTNPWVIPW